MPAPPSSKEVLAAVRASPGQRVKVAVSDIDGILRGKYLHKDKFAAALEGGFGFCDVVYGWDSHDQCYDNTTVTGWHRGFPDALARIDPAGTVSNGVVNYLVRINLDPTEAALRTNMTANARIILDTHSNVVAVPGGAIRQDATGYYVNVVGTDGTAQRVDVTTGYTDGDLTEVAGNLQAGQQVYISEPATTTTQQRGLNLFGLRIGG